MSSGTKKMVGNSSDIQKVLQKAYNLVCNGEIPPVQVVDAACWKTIIGKSLSKMPKYDPGKSPMGIFNGMDISDLFCNGKFLYARIDIERNGGEFALIENDLFLACHDIAGCAEQLRYPDEYHFQTGYDPDTKAIRIILMNRSEVSSRFQISMYFRDKDIAEYKAELESIIPGTKPFTSADYDSMHPQMSQRKSMFDKLTK
jgi:hypothetical protein